MASMSRYNLYSPATPTHFPLTFCGPSILESKPQVCLMPRVWIIGAARALWMGYVLALGAAEGGRRGWGRCVAFGVRLALCWRMLWWRGLEGAVLFCGGGV